ncbi:MAG: hypothetical protein SFW65_05940 [Alphaproteobacteria bacterium]|nr:hypothetical protein [Alphaproteobacteria bacterium]
MPFTIKLESAPGEDPARVEERKAAQTAWGQRLQTAFGIPDARLENGGLLLGNRGRVTLTTGPTPGTGPFGKPIPGITTDVQALNNINTTNNTNRSPFPNSTSVMQVGVTQPDGSILLARRGVTPGTPPGLTDEASTQYFKGKLVNNTYVPDGPALTGSQVPTGTALASLNQVFNTVHDAAAPANSLIPGLTQRTNDGKIIVADASATTGTPSAAARRPAGPTVV